MQGFLISRACPPSFPAVAITMDATPLGRVPRNGRVRRATRRPGPGAHVHQECTHVRVTALTLFAFSSENWRRPLDESPRVSWAPVCRGAGSRDRGLHANPFACVFIGAADLSVRLPCRASPLPRPHGRQRRTAAADRNELWGGAGILSRHSKAVRKNAQAVRKTHLHSTSSVWADSLQLADCPTPSS